MNIYVTQTPYHILLACLDCKKEDEVLYIGSQIKNCVIEQMVNTRFDKGQIDYIKPLSYYKSNVAALSSFRLYMKKSLKFLEGKSIGKIIVFNDVDPVVQWILHRLTYKNAIVVEEGIGLYRDIRKQNEVVFRFLGKILFGFDFENLTRIGTSKSITYIHCAHPERLNAVQKTKRIIKQEKTDFSNIAKELNIKQYNNRNWFIGQPLVEDGVLTEIEYKRIIRKIFEIKGIDEDKWIIKPHPREDISKYEEFDKNAIIIQDYEIPVELLINNESLLDVYTLYSSAILSLSSIKNVNCHAIVSVDGKHFIQKEIESMFCEKGVILENISSPNGRWQS